MFLCIVCSAAEDSEAHVSKEITKIKASHVFQKSVEPDVDSEDAVLENSTFGFVAIQVDSSVHPCYSCALWYLDFYSLFRTRLVIYFCVSESEETLLRSVLVSSQ
ncbi:hypothetical protein NPIL_425121 [Nephila pilipes]|uniref:Uncharacterized protein n=1 Tax=Nephila pilipes TaxID=299642 RepID=A0A8X6MTY4_NEPPI|nr:hypothetical protein NPIL_425121 [Nephila pilipes]